VTSVVVMAKEGLPSNGCIATGETESESLTLATEYMPRLLRYKDFSMSGGKGVKNGHGY